MSHSLIRIRLRRVIAIYTIVLTACLTITTTFAAENHCIGVFYPKVKEPYNSILREIIKGIENSASLPINHVVVNNRNENTVTDDLPCGTAIGLGKQGMAALAGKNIPVIASAVLAQPDEIMDFPTISLVPHPQQLFSRLRNLASNVKTVVVVYNKENSGSLITLAKTAAQKFGINLQAIEVDNIQQALKKYHNILHSMHPKRDALWLLRDRATIDANTIFPLVLKKSWNRKLMVFSSLVSHVKYGVLFSVYPDSYRLGQQLGKMATRCSKGKCTDNNVALLEHLRTAVNRRTATHLNTKFNLRNNPDIDLVFPN